MTASDLFFDTPDGLKLHARVRRHPAAGSGAPVMICLPGLTRNEKDFEGFAGWLTSRSFTGPAMEVICLSLRGRGRSAWDKNYLNYHPGTYVGDVKALMAARGLDEAIFTGTSLGGIVTMLLAATDASLISAAIINDIGPEIPPQGVARLATYVGKEEPYTDWEEAAEGTKLINGIAFPGRDDSFWRIFARRVCQTREDGTIAPAYDPAIAKALIEAGPAPALQPGFDALDCPILSVRGELSDFLLKDTQRSMYQRKRALEPVVIPETGHAPTLEEPEARKAVAAFLEKL